MGIFPQMKVHSNLLIVPSIYSLPVGFASYKLLLKTEIVILSDTIVQVKRKPYAPLAYVLLYKKS
jgi:hypothetical protein